MNMSWPASWIWCLVGLILSVAAARGAPQQARFRGDVLDENGSPVAGAEVVLVSSQGQKQTVFTDTTGRFEFSSLDPGEYRLSLSKAGFFRVSVPVQLSEGENEIRFLINHETEIHERVEVSSTTQEIRPQDTAHDISLVAREIRDIPVPSTHDLKSSLPVMPEIVTDSSGQLHVAGGRAGEASFILDGFNIGDPVDGDLTARVNVDSVRLAEVETSRYVSQYGEGGTGVLQLDTVVGDDRWRNTATNFIPAVNIQRGLRLGNWYPRFTVSGPLHKGRAWFSEALSLQHNVRVFTELPQNADTITQWSDDNLLRAQVNLTPTNILQGGFLYNQQYGLHLGLGPFSPIETTTTLRAHRSFFSLKDQTWSNGTYYEVGVAADLGRSDSLPEGTQPYVVKPTGAAGNYFETLHQRTCRWQGIASVALPSRHWRGTHNLQAGLTASGVAWTNLASRSSIEVLRANNTVVQTTTFSGPARFRVTDSFIGGYVQDTWQIGKRFVLQTGLREDWDRFLRRATTSPRLSANFLPFQDNRVKLSVGLGIFVQPLLLGVLGPVFDQAREDLFYDSTGRTPVLGPVISRFILPVGHLGQPRFYTTSAGWEQKIGNKTFASMNLIYRNEHSGLAYEDTHADQSANVFVLQNNRRDRYRSVLITVRHAFGENTEVSASYRRSSARTNEVFDYSLGTLVFAPQQPGPLPWDAPNRFISSGWAPAPVRHLLLSYFLEYRTGYPFSVVDERQQLVGPANRLRFPDYLSLNLGIEKPVRLFRRNWALRLAVVNATGRKNPNFVINNVDAPNFLTFAGGQGRAFSARIRLVR